MICSLSILAKKKQITRKITRKQTKPKKVKKAKEIKKSVKANNVIDDDKLQELKTLFFMDGITPYQASIQVGCAYETAKTYFKEWAEELTEDDEHETWAQREKRVRARALEGLTKKIIRVKTTLTKLEKNLNNLLEIRNPPDEKEELVELVRELEDDDFSKLNDEIERFERMVRMNRILEEELVQQYDAIEMMPPAEAILEREMEKQFAEKNAILTKSVSN